MNNIEVQPNREYILAGDISFSMSQVDKACADEMRYTYMLEKFKLFIKTAEDFDKHSAPTIILFGEGVYTFKETTLENISSRLDNIKFEGLTNLHLAIIEAYALHKEEKRELAKKGELHPGTVLFVFTDGDPTNRKAVERSIVDIANDIDREDEFNITFLTVGTITNALQAYLDNLHDDIEDQLKQDFDIIHVERLEDVDFLGAVNVVNHS